MSDLCSLTPEELVGLATSIAMKLSKGKSKKELISLKCLISHIHCTICALCVQESVCGKKTSDELCDDDD